MAEEIFWDFLINLWKSNKFSEWSFIVLLSPEIVPLYFSMKFFNSSNFKFIPYLFNSWIKLIILFLGPIGISISIKSSLVKKIKSLYVIKLSLNLLYKFSRPRFIKINNIFLSSYIFLSYLFLYVIMLVSLILLLLKLLLWLTILI